MLSSREDALGVVALVCACRVMLNYNPNGKFRLKSHAKDGRKMWWLFVCGVLLAVAAGALIEPSQVPWRAVEVTAISFGSLAIVSAIAEWRRMSPRNKLPILKNRVSSSLVLLASVGPTYLSIVRMRIESRASNLKQYEAALPWFERAAELAKVDEAGEPASVLAQLPDFPGGLDDREVLALNSEIESILATHEKLLGEYRQAKDKLERTLAEELATFAMPLLITLAVSLSLFKALYQP